MIATLHIPFENLQVMYLQNNTIFSQPSWSLLSNPFIKMESRADIKKRKKKVFIEFSFHFSTLELINSIARLFCFQHCYYNSILNHFPKHQKSSGKQQQPPKIQRLQIFTLLFPGWFRKFIQIYREEVLEKKICRMLRLSIMKQWGLDR